MDLQEERGVPLRTPPARETRPSIEMPQGLKPRGIPEKIDAKE
jgi:hypothetical protein